MMRLPHTDNAEHLWAFKKGYRFARQGKPLREMPLTIRTDRVLRDYFQQGYDQAMQQLAAQPGPQLTPKKRALWLVLTILAGLATAKLMIDQMRPADPPAAAAVQAEAPPAHPSDTPPSPTVSEAMPEKAPPAMPSESQTARASSPAPVADETTSEDKAPAAASAPQPAQTETTVEAPVTPATPASAEAQTAEQTREAEETAPDFSLLDEEARAKQLQLSDTDAILPPVVASDIQVVRAVLAAGVVNREPVGVLEEVVPKSMRRVVFFTEIKGAGGRTITHRWRHGSRVVAEVRLPIGSDEFRTWSSKRMSPAWSGRWWVEVVDEKGQVIARKGFRYVR